MHATEEMSDVAARATAPGPLPAAAQAILDELLRRLEPRLDVLAAAVAGQVREQVAEYQAATGRGGGLDYDESVRRISRVGLRVLGDGRPPTPDELVLLRAVGAGRAAQALSLESMLAGLRLGVWLGWNDILAHIRDLPLAEANITVLGTLATRLFGFADVAAAALSAGHGENRQGGRQREQARSQLLDELLGGAFSDDDMVLRAAGFGFDLTAPHGILLLTAADRATARGAATALRKAYPGVIVVSHRGDGPGHVPVLAPSAGGAAWERILVRAREICTTRRVSGVAVPPVARPSRIAAAYAEAAECVPLLAAAFRCPRIVAGDDLLAHRALRGGAEERRHFVERTLGRLLALPARQADPLLDTLEGLIEYGGSVEATRAALSVHDKTIRYRIRRIRELTGLCPLRERGRLELALMLHRLGAVEG